MINTHPLSPTEYSAFRYDFLLRLEETGDPKEVVYLDSASPRNPTIGIGFNLKDAAVRNQVFLGLGIDTAVANLAEKKYVKKLTEVIARSYSLADLSTLISDLNAVMAERLSDENVTTPAKKERFEFNEAEIISVFNAVAEAKESTVNAWLNIPQSRERAVLFSLAFNTKLSTKPVIPENQTLFPSGLGPSLRRAIISSNRAEAWYEIRYNTNKNAISATPPADAEGIAKRRYYESEVFNLYDDPASFSQEAAKDVYRMFSGHRSRILQYEKYYGQTPDGQDGIRGNRITTANDDYQLSGTDRVETIVSSLNAAKDKVTEWLNQTYNLGLSLGSFVSTNLVVDSGRNALYDGQGNLIPIDPNHASILDTRFDPTNLLMEVATKGMSRGQVSLYSM